MAVSARACGRRDQMYTVGGAYGVGGGGGVGEKEVVVVEEDKEKK